MRTVNAFGGGCYLHPMSASKRKVRQVHAAFGDADGGFGHVSGVADRKFARAGSVFVLNHHGPQVYPPNNGERRLGRIRTRGLRR